MKTIKILTITCFLTFLAFNVKAQLVTTTTQTVCQGSVQPYNITATLAGSSCTWTIGAPTGGNIITSYAATTGAVLGLYNISITWTATGTYTLTVVETLNGCSATKTVTVTVIAPPVLTCTPVNICAGTTLTLTGSIAGATYSWTGPLLYSGNGNPVSASATVGMSGTYVSTVTNIPGCTNLTLTCNEIVTVSPTPAPTGIWHTP